MSKVVNLKWRFAHGRWYLEDRLVGWAYVDQRGDGEWCATVPIRGVVAKECSSLREAKIWAKEQVVKHLNRRTPHPITKEDKT